MVVRTCSECGDPLTKQSPLAQTCSVRCRSARARRLTKAKRLDDEANSDPGTYKEIKDAVRRDAPSVVDKIMHQELGPIVREAITEDVLRAIQDMLNLTPRAVQLLNEDMESDDPLVRQKAYTLLLKYTAGHPALLRADDNVAAAKMEIHFDLPRPEDMPQGELEDEPPDADEIRRCDICNEDKPAKQFVGTSDRCWDCLNARKELIMNMYDEQAMSTVTTVLG